MFDNDRCGGVKMKHDSIVIKFPGALKYSDTIWNKDKSRLSLNNGNVLISRDFEDKRK